MAATKVPSPSVKSTIGMKNVVLCPLVTDTETEHAYDTKVYAVAGAVSADIQPQNADPDIQYADDVEFDVIYPDPDIQFRLKMADLPLDIQALIYSNKIDANGVLIRDAADKAAYFAVGFKSEKSDHTYRYVWLYKCRAKALTEAYATKEGQNVTRQNPEVEFTAIKRTHDGRYQAVADEGVNGFTAAKAATFLDEVYEYVAPQTNP